MRVLIGSTAKMGTGTNVQKRLVALHHLDAPWKPAEVEQREGRILRQGNEQRRGGDLPLRHRRIVRRLYVAGPGNQGPLHRAGDDRRQRRPPGRGYRRPGAVLRRGEGDRLGQPGGADAGRGRRRTAAAGHPEEEPRRRAVSCPPGLRDLPETIARLKGRLADLSADLATAAAHARDPLTVGDRPYGSDDALAALGRRLDALPEKVRETDRVPPRPVSRPGVRRWCCMPAVPPRCSSKEPPPATACFPASIAARGRCSTPSTGWPTATRARCDTARQDLAIAEGQLRDHQARLGRPFPHDAYLGELTDLRDQLKAGLSQATPEPGTSRPVAELAERIKALKAAHTIDAAPERTAPRRIAAEEPVTARIRRRNAPEPAIEPPAEPNAGSRRRKLPRPKPPPRPVRGADAGGGDPSFPGSGAGRPRPAATRLPPAGRPCPAAGWPPAQPVLTQFNPLMISERHRFLRRSDSSANAMQATGVTVTSRHNVQSEDVGQGEIAANKCIIGRCVR